MSPRHWRIAAWAALAVACLGRGLFLEDKPFWRDEAWVAVVAGEPLQSSVAGPRRSAPVGFVAVTRLFAHLPLPPEVGLRLVPLAAGLGALLAMAALARRLGGGRQGAVLALWLGAGLQGLIYYSRELKPYSLDLLFAALFPLLAMNTLHGRSGPRRRKGAWLALFLVAVFAPWTSFGSVFCAAATFVVATLLWWRRAGPDARRLWALAGFCWLVSFIGLFAFALDSHSSTPRMAIDWGPDMAFVYEAPLWRQPVNASWLYLETSLRYLFQDFWPVAVALILLGLVAGPRPARRLLGAVFLLVSAEVVATALLHRYVLSSGRLLLFTAAAYVLLAALGLRRAAAWLGPAGPRLALCLVAAGAIAATADSVRHRLPPYVDDPRQYFRYDVLHDLEPTIAAASLLVRPGEPVFVSRYAGEAFRYYGRGRLADATVCTRLNCRNEGPAVQAWMRGVERRGYMLLLDSDDGPGRRLIAAQEGCDVAVVAQARGTRLWRVTRRQPRGGTAG